MTFLLVMSAFKLLNKTVCYAAVTTHLGSHLNGSGLVTFKYH